MSALHNPAADLAARVDEILFQQWDPIGVSDLLGSGNVRDEYRSYVPALLALLRQGAGTAQLAAWLEQQAVACMGLSAEHCRSACLRAAAALTAAFAEESR